MSRLIKEDLCEYQQISVSQIAVSDLPFSNGFAGIRPVPPLEVRGM